MTELVSAKKCIVPTGAANVLQSLHMAEAFASAGAGVTFFPGVAGAGQGAPHDRLRNALTTMGVNSEAAKTWFPLPGDHAGLYGIRFRLALAGRVLAQPRAVFYARDASEASFLLKVLGIARRKRRFFFELHEVLHCQGQNAGRAAVLKRLESRILEGTDGLVVISPALEGMARDIFGYAKPILVESSAYNPAIFKPVPLAWPAENEPLQLVYLGRFHEGKGVGNLVAAMAYLPEFVHLRVIGGSPGSKLAEFREQARRIPGGENRIEFTGTLPQKDAAEACVGAHIFVIPQESDGLFFSPLKLYEAMGLGLPILVTPVGTFAPQREANLVATAPGTTPEALAQGVLALASDPERAAMLRENGLVAARTATWQARAARILEFCNSVK